MIKRLHSTLFYASDLKATADFYRKCGFSAEETEDGVRVKTDDFRLYFVDEKKTLIQNESGKTPKGLGVYTYVEVDDVDQHYAQIKQNGIVPRTEPKTWPWGKREFVVKDPDEYKIVFYSLVKK
ncbi:MAG: VOC family protein [Chloroflexi bacterium]|nr:VOC family protein [Chloroflexota bacterium]